MLDWIYTIINNLRNLSYQTRPCYRPKLIPLCNPLFTKNNVSNPQGYKNENLPSKHKKFYPFCGTSSIRRHTKLYTQKQPDSIKEKKREMKQRRISLENSLKLSALKSKTF